MRVIRERRGLTLVQVAAEIGISESALSQIELGVTKNIKQNNLLAWCLLFGEDPWFVVHGKPRKVVEREQSRSRDRT